MNRPCVADVMQPHKRSGVHGAPYQKYKMREKER